jgi:thiamine pyrophosphokinase
MINKGEQHLKHVVLVMGAFGGRLDHTLKNISTLKKYTEINQSLLSNGSYDMLFMDQYSTLLYLPAGENKISLSQSFDSDYGCGVFSFEEKQVEVETTGLEWNIGANYATKYLRFGNEESSSNRTLSKQINVISKNNLYWTNSILIK